MRYVKRSTAAVNGVAFGIQHVITADDPLGEPWAPDGSCSIVRRARGFTLWRRIVLTHASEVPLFAHLLFLLRDKTNEATKANED